MPEPVSTIKLISRKQFYVSALIGGPLMAGFMAAHNVWSSGQKFRAVLLVSFGLGLNLLMEAFLIFLVAFIFHPLGLKTGLLIIILLCTGGQLLFTWLISALLKIKNQNEHIFPVNGDYYGKWQVLPVLLLSLVYLFVHIDHPVLLAHFPNMILLFYLIPHFYFYHKIKSVFKSPVLVVVARWLIVVIACYMPLMFSLDGLFPRDIMNFPLFLAEYYIYTLLYLFLLILGVDLSAKLILKFQILPESLIRNPITKTVTMVLVVLCLTIILAEGNKRYNHLVVNSFDIRIPARDAEIRRLKICFVADMHLNNHTSQTFFNDYLNKISQINPDIVLYGGDMVEQGRISKEKLAVFDKQLASITPRWGNYIVNGNHDFFRYNGFNKNLDMTFLTDSLVKVANSFYLMGVSYRAYEKKPIAKLKDHAKENLSIIQLDHSPYQLDEAVKNHIDIQLSGHTHYGQVWPINYIIGLLYKLPWGYKQINGSHFFVTSGIQGWGTPIRTTGQAEIMVINVSFVK
jgi:predicted MPP superfamily phosphohydrolase